MGRANNPAAPQRVSAHVLPKVAAVSAEPAQGGTSESDGDGEGDDEDEKTMIEAAWEEDEGSTTVEPSEAVERARNLGFASEPHKPSNATGITTTNGGAPDEHTIDDQRINDPRVNAALMLPPSASAARLVVTQGTDSGRVLEVRPGKTYTVGRGIDNDLVLSDIAVSRKHFDLRSDDGAWVLFDRGSGNGTLINDQLEDAPAVLAGGDVIEIGNTAFRFDLSPTASHGPERSDPGSELEPSTVAGKPLRYPASPPSSQAEPPGRPKTLPPPAPLPRPRAATHRPPPGLSGEASALLQPVVPASLPTSLPTSLPAGFAGPGTSGRPRIGILQPSPPPSATPPTATAPPLTALGSRPPSPSLTSLAAANAAAAMLHSPGPLPVSARLPFYPPGADPSQPGGLHPPLLSGAHPAMRDHTSTALVQPMTYAGGMPAMSPQRTRGAAPPISPRMRLVLGAAGLAVFVAAVAVASLTSAGGGSGPAGGAGPVASGSTVPVAVTPAANPGLRSGDRPVAPVPPPPVPAATSRVSPTGPTGAPPTTAAPPVRRATSNPPTGTTRAPDRAEIERDAAAAAAAADARKLQKRVDKRPAAALRPDAVHPDRSELNRSELAAASAAHPERKRTARSPQSVKDEASALYRARNFAGAASAVTAALPAFTGDDAQELRTIAAIYSQLGKAYSVGMAPGTKSTEAFAALVRAKTFDHDVGSAFLSEIDQRLVVVASHAALSFAAAKQYDQAFLAVRTSDALGSTSPTNRSVRSKLEELAADLYRAAASELSSDPEGARRKLHQILGMIDVKHPLYAQANKLLNGS
jgi:pSer/pThr/pTyr-binding forkhead associated (FHA) protein